MRCGFAIKRMGVIGWLAAVGGTARGHDGPAEGTE